MNSILRHLTPPTIRFVVLFLSYLTVLVAATVQLLAARELIAFLFYASFLFFVLVPPRVPLLRTKGHPTRTPEWWYTALAILGLLLLLGSRIVPFLRYGATPLGYDTGFYWEYFNLIVPAQTIGTAVGSHLAYATWFPLAALGLGAIETITLLHLVHQLLTAGALYLLLATIVPRRIAHRVAACSVFLFAVSTIQFSAFWWIFYKQSQALPFFLFALALFFRRSWLALPIAVFATSIHLPTAIPLAGGFALYVLLAIVTPIVRRQRIPRDVLLLAVSGIVALVAVVLIRSPDEIKGYIEVLLQYRGFATAAQSWEIDRFKGLFLPFAVARIAALYYLPFAFIGLLRGVRMLPIWRNGRRAMSPPDLLITAFAVLFLLVSFPFLHQHRSLILFDVLLLVLAAPSLAWFMEQYGSRGKIERVTIGLLLFGMTFSLAFIVWNQKPQLYADEAAELAQLHPRNDPEHHIRDGEHNYVMVTSSLYTPWAYAYTGFDRTIAPGWLRWDLWDLPQWTTFWTTKDDAKRLDLLRMYGDSTIYIFVGRHVLEQATGSPMITFLETSPYIVQFSPHIWKYSQYADLWGGGIPDAYAP
ncbi:MAG: hypothetical protein Q7T01_03565 [bacterium]|nr:hypothetical protein [bacterium]